MEALYAKIDHAVHTLLSRANDASFDATASAAFIASFTSVCLEFRSGLITHLFNASNSKKEKLIIHFYQRSTLSHLEKIVPNSGKLKEKREFIFYKPWIH